MARTHLAARAKKTPLPVSKKHQAKYRKKNTSTFGPIGVLPKNNKWCLTASMGGTSNNKRRPKKLANGPRNNDTGFRPNKGKQQLNKWTLQMPVVSSTAPAVPWIPPNRHGATDAPSNKLRKILPTLSVPVAALEKLQTELLDFANYVRLSEPEILSRLQVVKEVQLQCHHLFGVSLDSTKVFGSFACLDVCTFASDVDLAIHDLVQATPGSNAQQALAVDDSDDDATPKRATKRQKSSEGITVHPNQKRQERVLEWKKLLDVASADEHKKITEIASQGTAVKPTETLEVIQSQVRPQLASPDETVSESSKDDTKAHHARVEIATVQPLPASAELNEQGVAFFVIDRDGCKDENDPKATEDPAAVTDVSRGSSILEEDDEEENREEEASPSGILGTVSKLGPITEHLEESEDDLSTDETVDSDDDSADKLAVLKTRGNYVAAHEARNGGTGRVRSVPGEQEVIEIDGDDEYDEDDDAANNDADEPLKVETRPRSRSLISLCSATTCSDNEEREWDESGMEVSFVSNGKASRTVPELSEEMRVKVIRALNALGRRLRGSLPLNHLHVRKKARVPIINLETRYGYECDIAVGGHQGMDTSGYAVAQCQRFQSFAPVVLVMKVLLSQHALDKPFSGGLGSFKLYVLVASHIEQHLSLGGQDHAAEILITFLFRFGRIPDTTRGKLDTRIRTELEQHTVVTTEGSGLAKGMADMSSVFQLDNSIKVFQACFFVLRRKLQKPNSDPFHSILGYLIDGQWLRGERTECRRKIPSLPSNQQRSHDSRTIPGLPANWRSKERREQALSSGSATKYFNRKPAEQSAVGYNTDEEAERLKASYGVGSSSAFKTDYASSSSATAQKKRRK